MSNAKIPVGYKIPVLEYHTVSDIPFGIPVYSVKTRDMEEHIALLSENGYTFITFDDLPGISDIKKPIMLTFDDGYMDNYTNLFPILKKYNAKATISVICEKLEEDGCLTYDQVREMSDSGLVSIQSHTMTHTSLKELDKKSIEYELKESKKQIFEITKKEPAVICYPMSERSDTVLECAKKHYSFGLGGTGGCHISGYGDFEISRFLVKRDMTAQKLIKELDPYIEMENILSKTAKISIIILNRNNKKIIGKCIDSVIENSRYLNYEIIVVDNKSTDGSLEMLRRKYKEKIRLLENTENGCSSGRNLGMSYATGDFLCFLDSDQEVTSEYWLSEAMKIMEDNQKAGAVGWAGGWLCSNGDAGPIAEDFPDLFSTLKHRYTKEVSYLGTGGMLVRKEVADLVGGFDVRYDPAFFEDTDFSLKIRKAGYQIGICQDIKISHSPHQTTQKLDFNKVFYEKKKIFLEKWAGEKIEYAIDRPLKILALSYYNPFNSGGGQRPLGFLSEMLNRKNEVKFIYESDSDTENMTKHPLFNHKSLSLLKHNGDIYETVNKAENEAFSEDDLLKKQKPDLIISFVPVPELSDLFAHGKEAGITTVYDQMDKWEAFPNNLFGEPEKEYVKNAVLCTTISGALAKEDMEKYGVKFFLIPNAVYKTFVEEAHVSFDEVKKRRNKKRKKILYAGALWPDWFDWDLLEYTVKNCPDYDFLVIGGDIAVPEEHASAYPDAIKRCHTYPNVTFTGLMPHGELPKFYKDADAAIIPFISNAVTKPCSPLKYYEYVSAHLPVVTTQIDDLEELPLVYTAKEGANLFEDFVKLLRTATKYNMSGMIYNEIENFARSNTWESRLDALTVSLFVYGNEPFTNPS